MLKPLLFAVLILVACEQKSPELEALEQPSPAIDDNGVNSFQLSQELWQIGQAAAIEALDAASALEKAIQSLLSEPNESTLAAARLQWQVSLDAFYRAQPYLMMGANLADDKSRSLAHWPFYPGFIDSYGPYRDSGLINAIDTPLNLSAVRQYHQQYEANELVLGFYPMAYLLWSEYQPPRPVEDFLPLMNTPAVLSDEGVKLTQLPQNRRRQMLRLQSEWLLIDIKSLYDRWAVIAADELPLAPRRLRMITDSLLLSLEGMLLQLDQGDNLPRQFIAQQQAGMQAKLVNIQSYYIDTGLAEFWLLPEEQEPLQRLLIEMQDSASGISSDALIQLIDWITPDATKAVVKDAVLSKIIEEKNTP